MKQNNFQRNCPTCGTIISYSRFYAMDNANKKNSKCKSCGIKGEKNPMFGMFKEKNPFFGKKHTKESKEKMVSNKNYDVYKTSEFRKKISDISKGENNPMYGKSFYDVWVNKYGIEIANQKMEEYKLKQSKNNSGAKNKMYGRPSPNGSGNGWSGWYNGWFFRSLLELSYMINVIERFNLEWKNAECDEYSVSYKDYKNTSRTYRADFIIGNKYLVEIKPKRLLNSALVQSKKKAAEEFCKKNGMIYKITQSPKISNEKMRELIESGKVILTDRYQKKLAELFG